MENRITTEEASEKLKDLLGVYRPEIEESIKLGIRVLDATPEIKEIPKDYKYDTETNEFEVYRHIYTGHEIHILKEPQLYRYDEPMIPVKEIKDLIEEYTDSQRRTDYVSRVGGIEGRDFAEGQSAVYEEIIEDLKELIKESGDNGVN